MHFLWKFQSFWQLKKLFSPEISEFLMKLRKFQNFQNLIVFPLVFVVKYRRRDEIIAGRVIYSATSQAMVVKAGSSQLRIGRVVLTGSHKKRLAEQGQLCAAHSTRHRVARTYEQPRDDGRLFILRRCRFRMFMTQRLRHTRHMWRMIWSIQMPLLQMRWSSHMLLLQMKWLPQIRSHMILLTQRLRLHRQSHLCILMENSRENPLISRCL